MSEITREQFESDMDMLSPVGLKLSWIEHQSAWERIRAYADQQDNLIASFLIDAGWSCTRCPIFEGGCHGGFDNVPGSTCHKNLSIYYGHTLPAQQDKRIAELEAQVERMAKWITDEDTPCNCCTIEDTDCDGKPGKSACVG